MTNTAYRYIIDTYNYIRLGRRITMTKQEELLEWLKFNAEDGNVGHMTYAEMAEAVSRSVPSVMNYISDLVKEKKITYDSSDKRNIKIKIL